MIRKFVSALILVPLAVMIAAFSVANRQAVTISFDPFDPNHPAYTFTLPLFALSLAFVIAGIVVGGIAAWLRQSRWRGRARRFEAEAREVRKELERVQRRTIVVPPTTSPTPASISSLPVVNAPRLMIPPRH
jgi:uncharacterized integral membrane protein